MIDFIKYVALSGWWLLVAVTTWSLLFLAIATFIQEFNKVMRKGK